MIPAWLFYCWTPGRHCEFASIDEHDTSWYPMDQWKYVARRPLGIIGPSVTLHGERPSFMPPDKSMDDMVGQLETLRISITAALKWLLGDSPLSITHAKKFLLIALSETENEFAEKWKHHIIQLAPEKQQRD